jgi:hypothetical protein
VFHGVEPDWIEMEMDDDPEFQRDVLEQKIKAIIRDEVINKLFGILSFGVLSFGVLSLGISSFDILSFDILLFNILLFNILLFDISSFYTLSFYTLSFYVLSFDISPFNILLFDILYFDKKSLYPSMIFFPQVGILRDVGVIDCYRYKQVGGPIRLAIVKF